MFIKVSIWIYMPEKFRILQELWKQFLVLRNTIPSCNFPHGCSHVLGNNNVHLYHNPSWKKAAQFERLPSRIKTIVSWKFSWMMKAISEQKIGPVTDGCVCLRADLYQAKRLDKPRIFWHYKINMLLLIHEYTLFFCLWSRHLKLYLRKWSLIQSLAWI